MVYHVYMEVITRIRSIAGFDLFAQKKSLRRKHLRKS
nr:MAG TPA: hypothetical protein [Caudoviricetes sp.]